MADPSEPKRPRLPTPFEVPADNDTAATDPAEPPPPVPQTRFSIRFLMLVTLVFAIATAGYNGMRLGGERRIVALLFTLLAPILVLVVLNLAQRIFRRRR